MLEKPMALDQVLPWSLSDRVIMRQSFSMIGVQRLSCGHRRNKAFNWNQPALEFAACEASLSPMGIAACQGKADHQVYSELR